MGQNKLTTYTHPTKMSAEVRVGRKCTFRSDAAGVCGCFSGARQLCVLFNSMSLLGRFTMSNVVR